MLLRAYAFCNRSRVVLGILLPSYLTLLAVDIWTFLFKPSFVAPSFWKVSGRTGCFPSYRTTQMQLKLGVSPRFLGIRSKHDSRLTTDLNGAHSRERYLDAGLIAHPLFQGAAVVMDFLSLATVVMVCI